MLYPHRLDVYRKSSVADDIGGYTETYSMDVEASDTKCNMRLLNAEELIINDKMSIEATHRIFPVSGGQLSGISVSPSDQVYVTYYNEIVSDLYEVKTVTKRHELGSGRLHHLEIDVEIIT